MEKEKAKKRSRIKAKKMENSDGANDAANNWSTKEKESAKSMTESDVELVDVIYRYGGEQAIESTGENTPLTY